MTCRCQERREAIRRAVDAKSLQAAQKEAVFVASTLTADASQAVARLIRRKADQ